MYVIDYDDELTEISVSTFFFYFSTDITNAIRKWLTRNVLELGWPHFVGAVTYLKIGARNTQISRM